MTAPRARKAMSTRIFTSVLLLALTIAAALSITLTFVYYVSYEGDYEARLERQAAAIASILETNGTHEDVLAKCAEASQGMRLTLIDPVGTVVFDSQTQASTLESHANRPEFLQARETGSSHTSRYSETLLEDTIYAAVRLSDGSVVRLSELRPSLVAFLGTMTLPFAIVLIVTIALAFAISRLLARRIMNPINAINLTEPLENDVYRELEPLLERIDEQQRLLKAQNRELAHAESMRRDFSANVSHEMKTPLQVISGYSELMMGGMVPSEDMGRFSQVIYEESQSMRQLVDDVLTLSKLDELPREKLETTRVDLRESAERIARRLDALASANAVEVTLSGTTAWIEGSASLVDETLHNLIENAIRYNHPGGQVHVSVSEDEGEVTLTVADTGIGIPEKAQAQVFERFYRVEKSRSRETGGTGLGLAIVKHAVLIMNGSIELKSAPNQGSIFTLRFPAAPLA